MGRLLRQRAALMLALTFLLAPLCAQAQSTKLEAAYVVLGPQGAVARAVLAGTSQCPAITIDGAQQPMNVRAQGDAAFPVLVCELPIPAGAGAASVENSPLPLPKRTLGSIAAFGDTGCRLKAAKGKANDPDDAANRGKFQDCNDPARWPFAQLATRVASEKPDLIIHVGDYLYRESACPPGDAGCARSPHGDDWPTWKADFFAPAAPALLAAPWIVVRGNHENDGHTYFIRLSLLTGIPQMNPNRRGLLRFCRVLAIRTGGEDDCRHRWRPERRPRG
jgi:hypothetical protein